MRDHILGILVALLGVNLWMVLCLSPLHIEWSSQDARPLALVVYLAPLLLLVGGVVSRWASLLLGLLPSSFLVVWYLLPELDRSVYTQPSAWLALAGSFLLYIVVAALWSNTRTPAIQPHRNPYAHLVQPSTPKPAKPPISGRNLESELAPDASAWFSLWRPYQGHFFPRLVILGLLFVCPFYGANFLATTPELYATGFEAQADQAQVMVNLAFLFIWVVVAYLFFIAPGLNLELEQRNLDRALEDYAQRSLKPSRSWTILLGICILIGALIALSLSFNLFPSLFSL